MNNPSVFLVGTNADRLKVGTSDRIMERIISLVEPFETYFVPQIIFLSSSQPGQIDKLRYLQSFRESI